MSQEPVRLAIIINDGGVIEQIISAGVPIEVLIVNYDIEDYEGDDVLTIDEDGPAKCGIWTDGPIQGDAISRGFVEKGFAMAKKAGL